MRATTAAARTQPASHTLLADEDAAKSIGRIFVASSCLKTQKKTKLE
jgi:hypothetical protein